MAPKHVLAIDQGTTSTRAIVFDSDGRPVASAQKELPQIFPKPGWVEHDGMEILHNTRRVIEEALAKDLFRWFEGTHLYPFERPDDTADLVLELMAAIRGKSPQEPASATSL